MKSAHRHQRYLKEFYEAKQKMLGEQTSADPIDDGSLPHIVSGSSEINLSKDSLQKHAMDIQIEPYKSIDFVQSVQSVQRGAISPESGMLIKVESSPRLEPVVTAMALDQSIQYQSV